ncbi:MAG: TlpA family protein disulfide reductase [Phycisphaerales bacterium]
MLPQVVTATVGLAICAGVEAARVAGPARAEPPPDGVIDPDTPAAAPAVLSVGDPAPAIIASKWIRGEAPEGWQAGTPTALRGQVFVVVFWASWNAPSRRSLEGQSRLVVTANAPAGHGDEASGPARPTVRVIGVAGTDAHGESLERVAAVLERRSEAIGAEVIFDDGARTREAWLAAALISNLPAAAVVAPDGRLAWIGNPAAGARDLARTVESLRAGTFDFARAQEAERVERERKARIEAQGVELLVELQRAVADNDLERVAEAADLLVRLDGDRYARLAVTRFEALVELRPDAARAYAMELCRGRLREDGVALTALGWAMLGAPGRSGKELPLVLEIARRACELGDGFDSSALELLARVHFERAEYAEALEALTKAAAAAPTEALRAGMKKTLDEYEAAAKSTRK